MVIGRSSQYCKKSNVIPILKKEYEKTVGSHRPVSQTSDPEVGIKQTLLEAISQHMGNKKIVRKSQHGSNAGKSCLTNLFAFQAAAMDTVDKRKAVNALYLDFSTVFSMACHSNPGAS